MAAAKTADREKAAAEEAKAKLRAQSRQKAQPGKPKKGARIWDAADTSTHAAIVRVIPAQTLIVLCG